MIAIVRTLADKYGFDEVEALEIVKEEVAKESASYKNNRG